MLTVIYINLPDVNRALLLAIWKYHNMYFSHKKLKFPVLYKVIF